MWTKIKNYIATNNILASMTRILIIVLLLKNPNYLLELYKGFSFPLALLAICLIFKNPINNLLTHLRNVKLFKSKDLEFVFVEKVKDQLEETEKYTKLNSEVQNVYFTNETASTELIAQYKHAFKFAKSQKISFQRDINNSANCFGTLIDELNKIKLNRMPKYLNEKNSHINESVTLFVNLYDTIPDFLFNNLISSVNLIEVGLDLPFETQPTTQKSLSKLVDRSIVLLEDFFIPVGDR